MQKRKNIYALPFLHFYFLTYRAQPYIEPIGEMAWLRWAQPYIEPVGEMAWLRWAQPYIEPVGEMAWLRPRSFQ